MWTKSRTACIFVLLVGLVALSALAAPPVGKNKSATQAGSGSQPAAEQMLFDFENPAEVKNWSALDDPKAKVKEPDSSSHGGRRRPPCHPRLSPYPSSPLLLGASRDRWYIVSNA